MNSGRKCLKVSLSGPAPAVTATTLLQLASHDALLQEKEEEQRHQLVEEDTTDSRLVITMEDSQVEMKAAKRTAARRRKRKLAEQEEPKDGASESEEEAGVEVEIDRQLDQSLETKSKQHNLTTVNVKNIIHEVITNEHVVAMMKAAINETEAVPPFEPKMTRSKLKEVVEKGVVIPTWTISPIKKTSDIVKAPQFVDIPLAEEDSSDDEYHPEEEEEDETAEDTFQESDMESTASSPRGSRLPRAEDDSSSPWQNSRSRSRLVRARSVSMGPPPPPKAPLPKPVTDRTFLEKLHAVEEELAVCMEPYQPLSESEDETGLMAYRTRSKRPLRDVPLGRLEAELQAPDITPDMYDSSSTHEDREWTDWLRGLMSSDMDNEEECDDEDDPEYNFLADIDEPDVEDYRDDKAVRITKKEVNELMEELFETLKEDLAGQEVDDEGHEEEEEPQEEAQTFQTHTPEEQQDRECADDGRIRELRTVKQQLALIRKKQLTGVPHDTHTELIMLKVSVEQKKRLQQQLQQHVQLLTQVYLLTSLVPRLHSEAETCRQFLCELDLLAQRAELIGLLALPGFCSVFRASNLQVALQLLEELRQAPISYQPQLRPRDARGRMRCFPVMPAELAWLFATRPVFMYPELLPCASLDPALYCPRRTAAFTAAEDCLLVLGLRNMEGSCDPPKLVSQFLLRKSLVQVRRRILQCCRPGFPDNVVKTFRYQRRVLPMPVACRPVNLADWRPPVEREESVMPLWLLRSLPVIYPTIRDYNSSASNIPTPFRWTGARQSQLTSPHSASSSYSFPPGTRYPPRLPQNLDFRRIGFVLLNQPHNPPSPDYAPSTPTPPRVLLHRLLLTRTESPTDISTATVSMATREQIRHYSQKLAALRRRGREHKSFTPPSCDDPTSRQVTGDDVIRTDEEEEEEGDIILVLSESSPSAAGSVSVSDDVQEVGSESKEDGILTPPRGAEEDSGDPDEDGDRKTLLQQPLSEESDEDDQRESEDVLFAHDYLYRVCEAVQMYPGLWEELVCVLDEFSTAAVDVLYDRISSVLQPWPQLLRDFAAFLNRRQARHCGLLLEQQLFERSRVFLWKLRWSLGESSALYQQVVSVLQGSSAPLPEDINKLSSLLCHHPDLQQELRQFYHEFHTTNSATQSSPDRSQGTDREEQEEGQRQAVCAKNITLTATGEKVVMWTREVDRAILTACRERGATWKTFRQVSTHLGNKTAQQVRLRFLDLMKLFHSAKSTSCSFEAQPMSRQDAPD
ncbi:LOW QUALITY PROTEIN: GON-4-like protein [Oreochromis niloticus]|uniref:LOW QUALITY PROTEIN: GON-4-like protein n=1 Tax=Oreochromis niloticus TaxID=8128 RepID=UPI000DF149CE|nr:LOW QUALITY PROTEIN: GON-4-like protein [Oreochromis niloticus]